MQQSTQAIPSSAPLSAKSTSTTTIATSSSSTLSSAQRFLSSTGSPLAGTITLTTSSRVSSTPSQPARSSGGSVLSSQVPRGSSTPVSSSRPVKSSSASILSSARVQSYQTLSSSGSSSQAPSSSRISSATKSLAASSAVSSVVPSATAAASYIDLGCWYDDTSAFRTFDGPSFTNSTGMIHELCDSFCTAHGMPYSGTEYGDECYCSDTPPASASADWCNMACPGKSTEICGSGDALSVLYLAAPVSTPTQSEDLVCFGDAVVERTMTGPSFTSNSMTNELCSTFCFTQGYAYSGTEYGDQCYCDDHAPWSASVGCGMPCAGNSSEICGDGDALAVLYTSNGTNLSSTDNAASNSTTSKLQTTVDLSAKFSSWATWKARGVNLGDWLLLEEWMDSSWFDAAAPGAVDEWKLCQTLGSNCTEVLQSHWEIWITQSDIAEMANVNVNTLRIPIGFWAFIDPLASDRYIRSTQLTELTQVLGYAQTYIMTVIVDLHGLPGSQNGQVHSGHEGTIGFYSADNQARSLPTIQAAATWIANSGFAGTTISALEVANEPSIANWEVWLQYKDYVVQAYDIVQSTVPSIATMFQDGFWDLAPWNEFFSSSDNAVIDTHKYWAFSPTTYTEAEADVCAYVGEFDTINLPVFVGEFSLSVEASGSAAAGFALSFFESQMSVWLQYAGAAFWSLKVFNANGETQNAAWAVESMIQNGLLEPSVWDFSNSTC